MHDAAIDRVIHAFLSADHARLDALLARGDFEVFRAGLLRHIAMEEKVLFAAARRDPELAAIARVLHADHAAIASLLLVPPTASTIATLRGILDEHDPIEDAPGGLYERCDALLGDGAADIVARMQAIAPVRVSKPIDEPRVHRHIARMIAARARGVA